MSAKYGDHMITVSSLHMPLCDVWGWEDAAVRADFHVAAFKEGGRYAGGSLLGFVTAYDWADAAYYMYDPEAKAWRPRPKGFEWRNVASFGKGEADGIAMLGGEKDG